jgi:hypothetical protein
MRSLFTAACLLPVALAASGCAPTTTIVDACAEMPGQVWPWRQITNARVEFLPQAGNPDLFPTNIVLVSGTIDDPTVFREPVPVKFECVFRNELLKTFGWIEPAQFVTPYGEENPSQQ